MSNDSEVQITEFASPPSSPISIINCISPAPRPRVSWKRSRAISQQVDKNNQSIEIEGVICQTWINQIDHSVELILKDSDNFLTFIFAIPGNTTDIDSLRAGTFCRFNPLLLIDKITTETWLPLFSVLASFVPKQAQVDKYYYSLSYTVESSFDILPDLGYLGIFFTEPSCPKLTSVQLLQFPKHIDCRFIVEGVLKKKSTSDVILVDEFGTVHIRVLSSFATSSITLEQKVKLVYLRMFRGICSLDRFSLIVKLPDKLKTGVEIELL